MMSRTNMSLEDIHEIVEFNVLMTSMAMTNYVTMENMKERLVKACNFTRSLNSEIVKYIDLLTEWHMNNKNTYKLMHKRSFGHDPENWRNVDPLLEGWEEETGDF